MNWSFASTARKKLRPGPVVQTAEGPVMGKTSDKGRMNQFAGIPFAAPPVGDLRWKAPQDALVRDEVLTCTKPGPMAHQRAQAMEEFVFGLVEGLGLSKAKQKTLSTLMKIAPTDQNEDCLYLGVRAPAKATGLPVMVWVHGGDHTDGSSFDPFYDSNAIPERGCVLVTINYRLGLMGFFAHPELAEESDRGVSGNYGLLDQIKALEWVRDNIANFGGDPDQVTIFGESAGGEAVLNLMTAPKARGLFHAVIAQSPSDSGRWLHLDRPVLTFTSAQDAGAAFAGSIVGDEPGQLERMRSESAESLYDRYRGDLQAGRYFYPVVDGDVLPTTPMTAFSNGAQAPVPLMIGYNADEGSLFASVLHPAGAEFGPIPDEGVSEAELRDLFEISYGSADKAAELLALYPGIVQSDRQMVSEHGRDHMFGVHVDHASRMHAAAGHSVHRYYFQAVPASPDQTIGAFHAAEIFYVFDSSLPLIPQPEDGHLLAREMGDRWFAFAATHDPNFPGRADWPRYEIDNAKHMVFDRPKSVVMPCLSQPTLDLMRERITYLNGIVGQSLTLDVREDSASLQGQESTLPSS